MLNCYSIEDIRLGMEEQFQTTVTQQNMDRFLRITGDTNPLHCDDEYAFSKGYEKRVTYGMLTASYLSTLAGVYLPGERSLIRAVEIKCTSPVYVGDVLNIKGTVIDINNEFEFIVVKYRMINQNGQCVLRGKMQIGLRE